MSYIGTPPNQQLRKITSQSFNGDGSTTVFTLNRSVDNGESLEVFVDNVQQEPGTTKSYTAAGTSLTFSEAPQTGTGNVYVIYRGVAEVTTRLEHDPNQALQATTGTFSSALSATTGTFTGNVDINGNELILDADGDTSIEASTDDQIDFKTGGSDRVTIDSSGNLMVGKTADDVTVVGTQINSGGFIGVTRSGDIPALFNRTTSDGDIVSFRKDGSTVGLIGNSGPRMFIGTADTGLFFAEDLDAVIPWNPSGNSARDNAIDLGWSSGRFDDIYATNGTIQTSDENEKQQIASLTSAEITAAKAISKLFKTFKWNDKVEAKGDAARTHTGVIAQQVETAMTDAGLDASDYAFFISDTWTNDDGNSQTRKGIRYPELLSFIGAATEQRLADLETRVQALEDA